jgi:hypothetical protein
LTLECGGGPGDDQPRRFRVSAGFGGARTTLGFTSGVDAAVQELSAVGRLELLVRPRLSIFAGAGSLIGGDVRVAGVDYTFQPGWLATAGLSWLAVTETPARPFVVLSGVASYAAASTQPMGGGASAPWRAGDVRLGAAVGKSFGPVRPYAVARVFGGPVSWRIADTALTGSDRHHYQLGAGAAVQLPGHLDLSVEAAALGEQGLVVGAGYAF